jgi:hypothetical protein
VSSPVEPLFAPFTLVGLLILLYIVVQLIHALILIGPGPEAPLPMAEIEARRHALGKVLSTLLFWSGLFLLDSLAWLSVFVQGDDLRVLPGPEVAVLLLLLLLAGSGLIAAGLVVRRRVRRRRSLGKVGSQFARR